MGTSYPVCSTLSLNLDQQDLERLSYRARYTQGEGKAGRKRDGKTKYQNRTGLKLGEALRKAENREEWRKVVVRLSFRLRDKGVSE